MSDRGKRRVLEGDVISDKMTKTVVVQVEHRVEHGVYRKYVTTRKRYKAHDETGSCRVGDRVEIIESRPLSRDKGWRVVRRLARSAEVE